MFPCRRVAFCVSALPHLFLLRRRRRKRRDALRQPREEVIHGDDCRALTAPSIGDLEVDHHTDACQEDAAPA